MTIKARVAKLEGRRRAPGQSDLTAEETRYGTRIWGAVGGMRCYRAVTGSALTILYADGTPAVQYVVEGLDLRDVL